MTVDKDKEMDERQVDEAEIHDEAKDEEVQAEEVEAEESEVEDENEIDENLNRLLRLQADFNNYKKRTEKEKESLVSFGVEKLACDLFPILDNLERALESQENKEDGFYQGVVMIYEQLISLLEKNSIEEIDALHKKFDPNFHYAVGMEVSEEYEEGTIINVLQKGYVQNDKVIRPTMVIVAQ